jgi:hypothetical protein
LFASELCIQRISALVLIGRLVDLTDFFEDGIRLWDLLQRLTLSDLA